MKFNFLKIRFLKKQIIEDEDGALNEFLGFIIFLMVIFCILVPLIVELMVYTGQSQEVDRLTKIAAKRACTLLANPTIGVGGDLKQGNLGMGTDISIMQPLVNQVFRNEAAHPEQYFQNTQDGQNIDLKIFDLAGQQINLRDQSNWVEVEDPNGRKAKVLLVGTNTESSLCPSGAKTGDWKYCLQGNDDLIKQQVRNTGINRKNADLIQRMQRFQAGRCLPGEDCQSDFVGRIDRCTVCVTKTRQSIFQKTAFFNNIIACDSASDKKILPCSINTCATEKLTRASTKRGYNPAYQDQKNLGRQFNSAEVNYKEQQSDRNTLLSDRTDTSNLQQNARGAQNRNATNNLFHDMRCQFLSVDDPAAAGCW